MIDTYASQVHYWDHLVDTADRLGGLAGSRRFPRAEWVPPHWRRPLARGREVGPVVLVAGYQDALAVERIGRRPVLVEHGSGQTYRDSERHPSNPGGRRRGEIGLFLCPNEIVAALNAEAYPDIPTAVVGSPHLDRLERIRRDERIPSTVGSPVLGLAWHWPCRVSRESGWAFPEWGGETLSRLVEAWPGPVLGTSHPRSLLHAVRWYEKAGIEVVPEWGDMVARVDVMSVDNSSVLFEAAALEIPVVLTNASRWRRDVDHGLRFWDYVEIGPSVWPTANARVDADVWVDAAWSAYDESYRYEAYARDMAAALYPYRGDAAEQSVAALETWLETDGPIL